MPTATLAKTVDFGAPAAYGEHVFRVEVPGSRKGSVLITEDFGLLGQGTGRPEEPRAVVKRAAQAGRRRGGESRLQRAPEVRRASRRPLARSRPTNLVDRLLGQELCVLAWAAETASAVEVPVICGKWAALRPEERWWLFSMTAAEAGLPQDTMRGWRRALYYALSDGERTANGIPPSARQEGEPVAEKDLAKKRRARDDGSTPVSGCLTA